MKYAGWFVLAALVSYALINDLTKTQASKPGEATTQEVQAKEIAELKAKVAELENKSAEHHYELRSNGARTWRFDPATGETCLQLASDADWKKPANVRQSCFYVDMQTAAQAIDPIGIRDAPKTKAEKWGTPIR